MHTTEYHSAIKKEKKEETIDLHNNMNLKCIMLNERS